MRKSILLILVLYTLFVMITACNGSQNTIPTTVPPFPSTSSSQTSIPTSFLDILLQLVPYETSEEKVLRILGKPDSNEEPLQGEWTWLYLSPNTTKQTWRVRFDTNRKPMLVSDIHLYNSGVNVTGMLRQFGVPTVTFQINPSSSTANIPYRFVFAYPGQGLYAFMVSPKPIADDLVIDFHREKSRLKDDYLNELAARKDIQIVQWP